MAKKVNAKAVQAKKADDKLATYSVVFYYVDSVTAQIKANNVDEAIHKAYKNMPVDQVCMMQCTDKTLPDGTVVNLKSKDSDERPESYGGWDTI